MAVDKLTGRVLARIALAIGKTNAGQTPSAGLVDVVKTQALTRGGGAISTAECVISTVRTLAASANETLDLASLTDPFGAIATMDLVTYWYMALLSPTDDVNNGTLASSITVGNASGTQFTGPLGSGTHTLTIPNGGFFFFGGDANGWAAENGVTDNLKVTNNDPNLSASYLLTLLGMTA